MKPDCDWLDANLEAYYCNSLSETDLVRVNQHLRHCLRCGQEVQALESIDPLVQQVFRHRFETARSIPQRASRQVFRPALAMTAILLVIFLGFRMAQQQTGQTASGPAVAPIVAEETVAASSEEKKNQEEPVQRAKPNDELRMPDLGPRPELDRPSVGGPDFAVIDAAGYSTTLDDYKGYVLVFGVWSETQPETTEALNRIYSAFGNDPTVRILGIAAQRENKLDRAAFPVVFNRGSQLLGLNTGEFVLVDRSGNRRLSGSLLDNPTEVISGIKAQIDQLEAK